MIKIKVTDEIVQAIDQAAGDDERAAHDVLAIVERDLNEVVQGENMGDWYRVQEHGSIKIVRLV